MKRAGQDQVINLLRCAWAGSQRYGALVWSGDITTTWPTFRRQLVAGLNMAMAGIPWWTTDIGGFEGGNPDDPAYRELLIRWFQWGAFCPVFRLHGFREGPAPNVEGGHPGGDSSDDVFSGGPNEVWSYGEEAYGILTKYLRLRESMRPYIARLMREASDRGSPVMRPLFYDFPGRSQGLGPGGRVPLWPGRAGGARSPSEHAQALRVPARRRFVEGQPDRRHSSGRTDRGGRLPAGHHPRVHSGHHRPDGMRRHHGTDHPGYGYWRRHRRCLRAHSGHPVARAFPGGCDHRLSQRGTSRQALPQASLDAGGLRDPRSGRLRQSVCGRVPGPGTGHLGFPGQVRPVSVRPRTTTASGCLRKSTPWTSSSARSESSPARSSW